VNVSSWEASLDKGFVARSKYRSGRKGVSNCLRFAPGPHCDPEPPQDRENGTVLQRR